VLGAAGWLLAAASRGCQQLANRLAGAKDRPSF
jgi:hypothetical protein